MVLLSVPCVVRLGINSRMTIGTSGEGDGGREGQREGGDVGCWLLCFVVGCWRLSIVVGGCCWLLLVMVCYLMVLVLTVVVGCWLLLDVGGCCWLFLAPFGSLLASVSLGPVDVEGLLHLVRPARLDVDDDMRAGDPVECAPTAPSKTRQRSGQKARQKPAPEPLRTRFEPFGTVWKPV